MCYDVVPPDIVVLGSGIVGSMCAKLLREEGYEVHLYERYSDIRVTPKKECSMNLVMTGRGLRAAELCGMKQELIDIGIPVFGRGIHRLGETDTRFMAYGQGSECNYSVHRFELNIACMNAAEKAGVKFYFDHRMEDIDFEEDRTRISFAGGETILLPRFCPIIAADGANSSTRNLLTEKGYSSFSAELSTHRYAEMTFYPNEKKDFALYEGELHLWPRVDHLLLCLPNHDKTFTGNLCIDINKWPKTREEAKELLETYYPDIIPVCGGLEHCIDQLMIERKGHMGTIKTDKWIVGGRICLIGDAAHAMMPFFGQGCNCGFEDCIALVEEIRKLKPKTWDDFSEVFSRYFSIRKVNADAMCDMSIENFDEMGRACEDPQFLLLKNIENHIEKHLPHLFRSRYVMVVYGDHDNVTYSAAQKLGVVQWQIVEEVAIGVSTVDDVDLEYAEKLIRERVVPLQIELGVNIAAITYQ